MRPGNDRNLMAALNKAFRQALGKNLHPTDVGQKSFVPEHDSHDRLYNIAIAPGSGTEIVARRRSL
jgi:hypothetical protein